MATARRGKPGALGTLTSIGVGDPVPWIPPHPLGSVPSWNQSQAACIPLHVPSTVMSHKKAHSRHSRSKTSHVPKALVANWRRLSFIDRNIEARTKSSHSSSAMEGAIPHVMVSSSIVSGPESLGCVLGRTLGSGTYAKVRAAWSQKQRIMIALKILNKRAASKDYLSKFLPRELDIVKNIRHPNIIRVHEILETENHCFFVLELAENGDLLDYINCRHRIPEMEARHIFGQMASAVHYCHSRGIAHRDLKCENIMLSKDLDVKVGDFGFAINIDRSPACTPCGSYSYAAPELFSSENGEIYDATKADVWSMGVILYAMVCGRLPFGDDSQVKQLITRELTFPVVVSKVCMNLINALLTLDPIRRLNSASVLEVEWLHEPSKKPIDIVPESQGAKYTPSNALPPDFHLYKSVQERANVPPRPVQVLPGTPMPAPYGVNVFPIAPVVVPTNSTSDPPKIVEPEPTSTCKGAASQVGRSPRIVARIGACGRRFAEAVKHVGQHSENRRSQRIHSRGSSGLPERMP